MMVGGEVAEISGAGLGEPGEVLVEVRKLSAPARTPFAVALRDVDLTVRAGEVIAIAGVAGNGQSELFDVLSGEVTVPDADSLRIANVPAGRLGITARRLMGCSFVPEERHGHAAVPNMNLSGNLVLSRYASDREAFLTGGWLGLISFGPVAAATKRISAAMDVRKSLEDPPAGSLSGGNLQKFIVGRELDRQPRVLVVNQPTWGVDAGAASRIRQALVDLAKSGSAVIVISQDLDEVFEIASSISVINEGQLSKPEPASSMTRERIGLLMGGFHDGTPRAGNAPEASHAH